LDDWDRFPRRRAPRQVHPDPRIRRRTGGRPPGVPRRDPGIGRAGRRPVPPGRAGGDVPPRL